jgi:GntR family transcriptional regulator
LRHKITTGEYQVGDTLPSEPTLAASFGVSRMTVREAVRGLLEDGLVRQIQGKGTFVLRAPSSDPRAGLITSIVGDISVNEAFPALSADPMYWVPKLGHIAFTTIEMPPNIGRILKLNEPTVVLAERIWTDETGPIGYVADYLPHAIGDRITREDLATAWLTQVLPEKLGMSIVEARQTIEATLADVMLGEKLDVPFGAPLLHAERVYIGEAGRPLYVAKVWNRGDRFRYAAVFRFLAANSKAGAEVEENQAP